MQRLPTPMFTLVVSHRLKLHCFRLLVTHRKGAGVGHRCREDVWFVISHLRYIHPTFLRCFRTSSREVKLGWPTVNSLSGKEIGRWVRPALPNTRGSDCMGRGHVKALVSEGIESRASIRAGLPGWGKEFIDLAIQIDNLIHSLCSTRATPRYMPENTTAAEPMQLGFTHLTPKERERWMQNQLCLYCGQAGHLNISCPVRPFSSFRSVSVNPCIKTSALSYQSNYLCKTR